MKKEEIEEIETTNLNVEINKKLMGKIKAKAALLGLDLKTYVSRTFENSTSDISEVEE
jgi:hypothetical protein